MNWISIFILMLGLAELPCRKKKSCVHRKFSKIGTQLSLSQSWALHSHRLLIHHSSSSSSRVQPLSSLHPRGRHFEAPRYSSWGHRKIQQTKRCSSEPPWDPLVPLVEDLPPEEDVNKYSCTLVMNDEPLCSAVIISGTFVLSPCNQCLRSKDHLYIAADFEVQYGYFDDYHDPATLVPETHSVRRLFCNNDCYDLQQKYNPSNDIAVIQINGIFNIAPRFYAKLPRNKYFSFNITQDLHLSNYRIRNVLALHRKDAIWDVLTKVVDRRICAKLLGRDHYDLTNICAAYFHLGGDGTCISDIGSGLALRRNRREEILIGLLIYKFDCGAPRSVASFVSVRNHLAWIRSTVFKYSNGKEII